MDRKTYNSGERYDSSCDSGLSTIGSVPVEGLSSSPNSQSTSCERSAIVADSSSDTSSDFSIFLKWCAGFFDGEGWIHVTKRGELQVGISNCSREAMLLLVKFFGGKITEKKPSLKRKKTLYTWRTCNGKAKNFLQLILPYLVVRKEQATLAIEYFECVSKKTQLNYYRSKINKRVKK